MLQASRQWKWIPCSASNLLLLELNPKAQLRTPFKLRQLTNSALDGGCFSLQDAAFYEQVCSYLKGFNILSDEEICHIALNATAAKFQLKPQLAKSWFFKFYTGSVPSTEAIVKLTSAEQSGQFLIIECQDSGSLCMNLEATFKLDENLSLKQFEVIKVLNDRIHPILTASAVQKRA